MKKLVSKASYSINSCRSFFYTMEACFVQGLSRKLEPFVKAPKKFDKVVMDCLKNRAKKLHDEDAKNIQEGIYPFEVLVKPKWALENISIFPRLAIDYLMMARKRKMKTSKKVDVKEDLPDYVKRNFHFQTDGYFSENSARLYSSQVEILFYGTAAPMRRMLIKEIKKKLGAKKDKPLKILEIAAGVGGATSDFSKSFHIEKYVVTDISEEYLSVAKEHLADERLTYRQAIAEELPFQDEEFDVVFSVFLFHELPRRERETALLEAKRVLKKGGVFAFCDSLQKDDDIGLNPVIENFPIDYHEPFFKAYTLWDVGLSLSNIGFKEVSSKFHLLSKHFTAVK